MKTSGPVPIFIGKIQIFFLYNVFCSIMRSDHGENILMFGDIGFFSFGFFCIFDFKAPPSGAAFFLRRRRRR
jgi:hypothetical protein